MSKRRPKCVLDWRGVEFDLVGWREGLYKPPKGVAVRYESGWCGATVFAQLLLDDSYAAGLIVDGRVVERTAGKSYAQALSRLHKALDRAYTRAAVFKDCGFLDAGRQQ